MGSRAGPRAGLAQRSRKRRRPDGRHDAARPRRAPRAGRPTSSTIRSRSPAGCRSISVARISNRPSKARRLKSRSRPSTATCAWSAARARSSVRSVEGVITVEKATGQSAGDDRQRRHPALERVGRHDRRDHQRRHRHRKRADREPGGLDRQRRRHLQRHDARRGVPIG